MSCTLTTLGLTSRWSSSVTLHRTSISSHGSSTPTWTSFLGSCSTPWVSQHRCSPRCLPCLALSGGPHSGRRWCLKVRCASEDHVSSTSDRYSARTNLPHGRRHLYNRKPAELPRWRRSSTPKSRRKKRPPNVMSWDIWHVWSPASVFRCRTLEHGEGGWHRPHQYFFLLSGCVHVSWKVQRPQGRVLCSHGRMRSWQRLSTQEHTRTPT
mmetsp:Transcript_25054/g.65690  ORF Transcript_25054/g.65690 Transcript_25054/m.65690 type:complete len:210 (+) Transcript_25054:1040-1669(+)